MEYHLIIVPHTRWDREGYAPFERFRQRLAWAIDDLLDAMEAPGGMPYFMLDGQTSLVLDYLAARPENRSRLLALVEAGRLAVGPWHVLPDEFLVSQESLIRNLARGLADAGQLGGAMPIGYLPDAFGHVGQMPQILRGFGLEAAVVWRGVPASITRTEFLWQSPDGSQVLAVYLPLGYEPGEVLPADTSALAERLRQIAEGMSVWQTTSNVLVLSGGDHLPPQLDLPVILGYLQRRKQAAPSFVDGEDAIYAGPERHYNWELGRLTDYVDRVRADVDQAHVDGGLPAHVGELRDPRRAPLASGVASARVPCKVRDFDATRRMETRVEPLAVWCLLNGFIAERRMHGRVWNLLLRNQAQPSICGVTHDDVQYDIEQRYHRAGQLIDLLVDEYMETLSTCWPVPETPAQTLAQVATFNPAGPRPAEVCSGTVYTDTHARGAVLRDSGGADVDAQVEYLGEEVLFTQVLSPEALLAMLDPIRPLGPFMGLHVQRGHFRRNAPEGGDDAAVLTLVLGEHENSSPDLLPAARAFLDAHSEVTRVVLRYTRGHAHRLTFVQHNVTPGQLATFTLIRTGLDEQRDTLTADDRMLTNTFYRLTWDGEHLRLFDRRSGRRFGPLNVFADVADKGDLHTFCPLLVDPAVDTPTSAKAEVVAEGPVFAAWRIRQTYEVPLRLTPDRLHRHSDTATLAIETTVKLYAGLDRVDFTARLRNRMRDHRLRVGMMTPIDTEYLWCDGQFELVRRPIARPPADKSWAEMPSPTHTFNGFAAVSDTQSTFLLMTRGLREVEAASPSTGSAEGDTPGVALWLTLLRCVGERSRHDLETRPAGAMGPALATPEAQLAGVHAFEYSLTVLPESIQRVSLWDRVAAYQAPSLVWQVWPTAGSGAAPGMAISDPDIEWSALKPADREDAVILRLVNKRAAPKSAVRFAPGAGVARVFPANLREEPEEGALVMTDGEVALDFAPYQIRTLFLELAEL